MRILCTVRNALMGLGVILIFLLPPAWGASPCDRVASTGSLNILTVNILFSETETRDQRLAAIADFIAANEVHLLLLQEVVGGLLVGTGNSARDLQDILREKHGLMYERRTALEVGFPGLLTVGNAILSCFDILYKLVTYLPFASELDFHGLDIKLPRNVLMTRLRIPGFGNLSVYNTHLCAFCLIRERQEQLAVALNFIKRVERFLPGTNPVLFGGDFNIDRFRSDATGRDSDLYKLIVEDFQDAYAASQPESLDTLCADPTTPDAHCTFGVTSLPGSPAQRIDYVFGQGFGTVLASDVVFNTEVDDQESTVSDHAGVSVQIALPGF